MFGDRTVSIDIVGDASIAAEFVPFSRNKLANMVSLGGEFLTYTFRIRHHSGVDVDIRLTLDDNKVQALIQVQPCRIMEGLLHPQLYSAQEPRFPAGDGDGLEYHDFQPATQFAAVSPAYSIRQWQPSRHLAKEKRFAYQQAGANYPALGIVHPMQRATMFSGMMRKVVQCLYGTGAAVGFDHRFQCTHGILKATDTNWWVVQICSATGIHAAPMRFCRFDVNDEKRMIPVSRSFPALDEDEVIQLAPSFSITGAPFYEDAGWAFSYSGTEAQAVTWIRPNDVILQSFRWKVSITVNTEGLPVSASVEAVEASVPLYGPASVPFNVPGDAGVVTFDWTAPVGMPTDPVDAPIHVFYTPDDVPNVVRFQNDPVVKVSSTVASFAPYRPNPEDVYNGTPDTTKPYWYDDFGPREKGDKVDFVGGGPRIVAPQGTVYAEGADTKSIQTKWHKVAGYPWVSFRFALNLFPVAGKGDGLLTYSTASYDVTDRYGGAATVPRNDREGLILGRYSSRTVNQDTVSTTRTGVSFQVFPILNIVPEDDPDNILGVIRWFLDVAETRECNGSPSQNESALDSYKRFMCPKSNPLPNPGSIGQGWFQYSLIAGEGTPLLSDATAGDLQAGHTIYTYAGGWITDLPQDYKDQFLTTVVESLPKSQFESSSASASFYSSGKEVATITGDDALTWVVGFTPLSPGSASIVSDAFNPGTAIALRRSDAKGEPINTTDYTDVPPVPSFIGARHGSA